MLKWIISAKLDTIIAALDTEGAPVIPPAGTGSGNYAFVRNGEYFWTWEGKIGFGANPGPFDPTDFALTDPSLEGKFFSCWDRIADRGDDVFFGVTLEK
jgi:hypothetical protein